MPLALPGFRFSQTSAEALARMLRETLIAAEAAGIPPVDQLGALALAQAALLRQYRLSPVASTLATQLRDLVLEALAADELPF